jgi:hypothetical protein
MTPAQPTATTTTTTTRPASTVTKPVVTLLPEPSSVPIAPPAVAPLRKSTPPRKHVAPTTDGHAAPATRADDPGDARIVPFESATKADDPGDLWVDPFGE